MDQIPRDTGEKRLTRRNPNECPACEGYGYTEATETIIVNGRTKKQGSACDRCHGVGRL